MIYCIDICFRVACLWHVSVWPDNQNFCHNQGNFKAKTTGGLGEKAVEKAVEKREKWGGNGEGGNKINEAPWF